MAYVDIPGIRDTTGTQVDPATKQKQDAIIAALVALQSANDGSGDDIVAAVAALQAAFDSRDLATEQKQDDTITKLGDGTQKAQLVDSAGTIADVHDGNTDAHATTEDGVVTQDRLYGFNGSEWDRLRASIDNGLAVDVTRMHVDGAEVSTDNPVPVTVAGPDPLDSSNSTKTALQPGSFTAFTADNTTDTFTSVGHGLANGDPIVVKSDDTLPAGLVADQVYYITAATTDTFKLNSSHPNSVIPTAVVITDDGTGTHSWATPGKFEGAWTRLKTAEDLFMFAFTAGAAFGDFYVEWSSDGVTGNIDALPISNLKTVENTDTPGFWLYLDTLTTNIDNYYRVVAYSGSGTQTLADIRTWVYPEGFHGTYMGLNDALSSLSTAFLVRAVIATTRTDGTIGNLLSDEDGFLLTASSQVIGTENNVAITLGDPGDAPGNPFVGTPFATRARSVQENLTTIAAFDAGGNPLTNLGGTFTFRYHPDDGTGNPDAATIEEASTIRSFGTVRSPGWLSNAGDYYSIEFEPDRTLLAGETVVISTVYSKLAGNDFKRGVEQVLEQENSFFTTVQSFIKGFDDAGDSKNIRVSGRSNLKVSQEEIGRPLKMRAGNADRTIGGENVGVIPIEDFEINHTGTDPADDYEITILGANEPAASAGSAEYLMGKLIAHTGTDTDGGVLIRSRSPLIYASGRETFERGTFALPAFAAGVRVELGLANDTDNGNHIFLVQDETDGKHYISHKDGTTNDIGNGPGIRHLAAFEDGEWNGDPLDGSDVSDYRDENGNPEAIDWTKGQLIRIRYIWHGYGVILIEVMSPNGEDWVVAHQMRFINKDTDPSLTDPDLYVHFKIQKVSGADTSDHTLTSNSILAGKMLPERRIRRSTINSTAGVEAIAPGGSYEGTIESFGGYGSVRVSVVSDQDAELTIGYYEGTTLIKPETLPIAGAGVDKPFVRPNIAESIRVSVENVSASTANIRVVTVFVPQSQPPMGSVDDPVSADSPVMNTKSIIEAEELDEFLQPQSPRSFNTVPQLNTGGLLTANPPRDVAIASHVLTGTLGAGAIPGTFDLTTDYHDPANGIYDSGFIPVPAKGLNHSFNARNGAAGGSMKVYLIDAEDDQGTNSATESFAFPIATLGPGSDFNLEWKFVKSHFRIIAINDSGTAIDKWYLGSRGSDTPTNPLTISLDQALIGDFPGIVTQTVVKAESELFAGIYEAIKSDGAGRLLTNAGSDFARLLQRNVENDEKLKLDVEPTNTTHYIATAPKGTSESVTLWDVIGIKLSGTRNPTDMEFVQGIAWDDRTNPVHWGFTP